MAGARIYSTLVCAFIQTILLWFTCSAYHLVPESFNLVCLNPLGGNDTQCFNYGSAYFGEILRDNLRGYGIISSPKNACSPVRPLSSKREREGSWFLIIEEGSCSFGYKALMAQNGGYVAAIIYNRYSNRVINMDGDKYARQAGDIVAIYVGKAAGNTFVDDVGSGDTTKDEIVITPQEYPYLMNLEFYLIPFAVIVGICFVLMAMFMISRYYRSYLEKRRNRLTPTNLRKIPTKKFKKGDEYYDVCAICLDEYKEGDRLRILPCDHAYHCKCVDPWLTEGKKTCPVCKRPVETDKKKKSTRSGGASGAAAQHDDSASDREPTETTPLIRPFSPSAPTSTAVPV